MDVIASIVPTLPTARLILRPFADPDAADVVRLVGVHEVSRTVDGIPHPYPFTAAIEWIATHAAAARQGKGYTWAIVDRASGILLGSIALHLVPGGRNGGVGYWLGMPFWNHGYATEAAQGVVAYAFGSCGLHRLQAQCLPSNTASRRVLEKVGFLQEGVLRQCVFKDGTFEDRAVYGLIVDDDHG